MKYIVQIGFVEIGELGVINNNPKVELKTSEEVKKFLIEKGITQKTSSEIEYWCQNTSSCNEIAVYEWDKAYGSGFKILAEE